MKTMTDKFGREWTADGDAWACGGLRIGGLTPERARVAMDGMAPEGYAIEAPQPDAVDLDKLVAVLREKRVLSDADLTSISRVRG